MLANLIKYKLGGQPYHHSLFRIGMVLEPDPTPFILSAHGRPTASFTPPGGNGMTRRIGRSGYLVCANARGCSQRRRVAAGQPTAGRADRFFRRESPDQVLTGHRAFENAF